jgi:hypothetical protein
MKIYKTLACLIVATLLAASCKTTSIDPNEKLIGMWNVTKVEGTQIQNGVEGIMLMDDSPSGYIRFDSDGRGEQNYSFTLFNSTFPFQNNFRWTSTPDEIRIDLIGDDDMIWTRHVNEAAKQEASYSIIIDAANTIEYRLTLEK